MMDKAQIPDKSLIVVQHFLFVASDEQVMT
jgi:hypothetical protein